MILLSGKFGNQYTTFSDHFYNIYSNWQGANFNSGSFCNDFLLKHYLASQVHDA